MRRRGPAKKTTLYLGVSLGYVLLYFNRLVVLLVVYLVSFVFCGIWLYIYSVFGRHRQLGQFSLLLQQVGCVYLVVFLLYFVAFDCTHIVVFRRHRHLGQCSPLLQQGLSSLAGQGSEGRDVQAEA